MCRRETSIVNEERQRGMALVTVLLLIVWLTALAAAATLATLTETAIAANYREATEAFYAAEAVVEFVMQEIAPVSDWSEMLSEPGRSAFTDGPPAGGRTVGSFRLDLAAATRDVQAMVAAPPGAVQSPLVLYAFGRFRNLAPAVSNRSPAYVAAWIADRSEEERSQGSGPDRLSVVGQAYGPRGSRRSVEALVARTDGSALTVLAWRELR
jgi:hypothetical protein